MRTDVTYETNTIHMKTKKLITWSGYTFYLLVLIYLSTLTKHEFKWITLLHVMTVVSTWVSGFEFIRKSSLQDFVDEGSNWKSSLWLCLAALVIHIPVHTFYMGSFTNDYKFEIWHLFFGPYLLKTLYLLLQTVFIAVVFRTIWFTHSTFRKNRKKIIITGTTLVLSSFILGFGFIGYNHMNVGDDYLDFDDQPKTFKELIANKELAGKYVYVDFWHSGCQPCLMEMTQSKGFKASLSKNLLDEIVFLFVGVDRSKPGEKTMQQHWINKLEVTGKHHFISRDQFRAWWPEIKAHEEQNPFFPYHLWINPKGEIIVRDAPGLGDNLRDLIASSIESL